MPHSAMSAVIRFCKALMESLTTGQFVHEAHQGTRGQYLRHFTGPHEPAGSFELCGNGSMAPNSGSQLLMSKHNSLPRALATRSSMLFYHTVGFFLPRKCFISWDNTSFKFQELYMGYPVKSSCTGFSRSLASAV